MSDKASVETARASVASAFNRQLKNEYNTRLNVQGSGDKEKARNLPPVDRDTGGWTEDEHKPPAWLVAFELDGDTVGVAETEGRRPHRLVGTYNCKSTSLQGVLARVIPLLKTIDGGVPDYQRHQYWEWALAFVFPGRATFVDAGSAAATLDFNPQTGSLSSTVKGRRFEQPYVFAALFGLVEPDDVWPDLSPETPLTYALATDLLRSFLHINTDPSVASVTDVDEDFTEPELTASDVEDVE